MTIMLFSLSLCVFVGGIGWFLIRDRAEESIWAGYRRFQVALIAGAFLYLMLWCMPVGAQEVVHAQTGKVVAVDAARKTLTLKLADGSTVTYQDVPSREPELSLDKAVRAKTVPVATFTKVGANVVVLYFGYETLTAIAVKDIGADVPKVSTGSVSEFDRHQHCLTLKTDAAAAQTLTLTDDTIVDTNEGVVKLADYKPSKGEHLRCFTGANPATAVFVTQQ